VIQSLYWPAKVNFSPWLDIHSLAVLGWIVVVAYAQCMFLLFFNVLAGLIRICNAGTYDIHFPNH